MGLVGGGVSPRRIVQSDWIASSLSGKASWTPLIAALRHAMASRILSVAVVLGTGMEWWQKQNVLVMRSLLVSAMMTWMQQ